MRWVMVNNEESGILSLTVEVDMNDLESSQEKNEP